MKNLVFLFFACFLGCFFPVLSHAQCSPFMGAGNVQFLDNNAKPLTVGVLYAFQAGTSTQQATFTSSTCAIQNTNPITFGSGGRAAIWLTTSATYKFVLCAQNDGAACSAGDIIFSVDQVPGGSSGGGGGGGSPFIGIFISGSSNPATAGASRYAAGDQECWRNAANSGNLCWTKDSNDLLSWPGAFKLPEGATPTSVSGFDILEPDATAHRYEQCSNGAPCAQLVDAGVDINSQDQVTQLHFGATATPLSGTAPTTSQFTQWNGTNIVGRTVFPYSTASASTTSSIGSTTMATAGNGGNVYLFNATATITTAGTGCTVTTPTSLFVTLNYTDNITGGAASESATINLTASGAPNGIVGTAVAYPAVPINAKASTSVTYSTSYVVGSGCSPGPAYYVQPTLIQVQ